MWKNGNASNAGYRYLRITWCPSDPPTSTSATDTPCSYTANGLVLRNSLLSPPLQPVSLDYVNMHDGTATTLLLSRNCGTTGIRPGTPPTAGPTRHSSTSPSGTAAAP